MKRVYANLDSDNRIDGATYREDCAGTWQSYEVPDDFDMASARDWVLVDGVMTYSPLPTPEPEPSLDQRVTDVETQLTALTSAFDTEEVTDGN